MLEGKRDGGFARGRVVDGSPGRDCTTACCGEFGGGQLGVIPGLAVHDDRGTLVAQRESNALADAAGSAGYNGNSATVLTHARSPWL